MSYPISLKLQPKQAMALKQSQLLMMLPQMRQALTLLQMPIMELTPFLEAEMERNPLLECEPQEKEEEEQIDEEEADGDSLLEKEMTFDERDFEVMKQLDEQWRESMADSMQEEDPQHASDQERRKSFAENSLSETPTLFGHLMKQAQESFADPKELALAEALIGHFDEHGFLHTNLEEIATLTQASVPELQKVLKEIQTFEPYGVGAHTVQESLLIQLLCLGKKNSFAYEIVESHYDDLLHNRIPKIQKELHCSYEEIKEAIDKHIAKLDLRPGAWYLHPINHSIIPDLLIRQENEEWIVETNDDSLPSLRLNQRYLRMLEDETLSIETKEFIRHHLMSAKWLVRNIYQRNDTLLRIGQYLVKKQKAFLGTPDGELLPLTMKEVAEELELHESTIARAVANKYVHTPRGLLSLRSFFTTAYSNSQGQEISANTVCEAIQELINTEDKKKPLSDEAISLKLKERGILCARRTVAKHRHNLNIGTAQQRKQFVDVR